ncbi:Transcriptional regulator, GntR family [Candidatus Rhodobacter oscarellae]|uniref:Transcriptional regulator, GntR family n=1 Tax=Candidatus Rhodobacter oscarellae TaxID=1675527 RepID=A0A0J9E7X2_9RHOB|nr:GntR family transcriptional regulator [Candidatus Rhodobacter lobularis]KMW58831.1 Transcriptional regulator, GntR family [Candidatus Rhodobacter lobularis]
MNRISGKRRFAGRPSFEASEGLALENFRRECSHVFLSREAPLPLWEQLYQHLENLILSGKLAVNSRIPPEPILCDLFRVSKPVVRHAISALAAKGLVLKLPRKGMFVAERPKESGFITSNISLFDDMLARGATIDTRTFDFVTCPADAQEQAGLGLLETDQVIRITRVFRIDGQAITHSVMSFPAAALPGFTRDSFRGTSIQGVIRREYGLNIVRADRWLNAEIPPGLVLDRMGIAEKRSMIFIESTGYAETGERLEYYRAYYDSSVARIRLSVSD